MVASLALIVLSSHRFQTPALKDPGIVVLTGVVSPGRCRIPISVAGRSYLFLLDTGMEKSYVREDVKQNALRRDDTATLDLATGSVPLKDVATKDSSVYREVPAIAGILGMDVLAKLRFTVDYDAQNVTVWPKSSSSKDLEAALLHPGEHAMSLDLISEEDTACPFVQTSFGDAELDTGAALSLLPKTAASSPEVFPTKISRTLEMFDTTAGTATQAIARNLQVGSQNLFCQPALLSDTAQTGIISPGLFGRRILFDLPNKRLTFAESSSSDQACRIIGTLLHTKVEARGGDIYLKALLPVSSTTKDAWLRIASINGRTGSDWLSLLVRKDPSAALALQHAYNELGHSGKVFVEHDNKQTQLAVETWAPGN